MLNKIFKFKLNQSKSNNTEKTTRQTNGATRIALKASMKILVLKLCVVAVLFSF